MVLQLNWPVRILVRDWHPANHSSFKVFPTHNVADTDGAELHPAIRRGRDRELLYGLFHHEVRKGTERHVDAYSGFKDRNGYPVDEDSFNTFLKEKAISRLFLLGNEAMHCIGDNALPRLASGIKYS